jgi:nicotinamide-nucleotide amidase
MPKEVEIVSIGNELLIGKTANTNAQWLAKRATSLGLPVRRVTVISDDVKEIAKVMKEAIHRNPTFIVTTGGLGPTFDDKALEGIAKALRSKLTVNEEALRMVKEKYVKYAEERGEAKIELTPPRIKMAKLPAEAKPLPNPVGTAPGVAVKEGDVTIFALPGVPSEMKAIFEGSLLPILKAAAGDQTFFETSLYVTGIMESEMAPAIDSVMHDNPHTYIKSHPMGAEKKPSLELHISTTTGDIEVAKKRVSRTLIQLTELIRQKGGKTRTPQEKNNQHPP